ncbi:hypothetical protein JCM10450v2_008012 [Rhodotorula kratochvilovae]
MSSLPHELVLETILLSLDPPSPASSSASSSPSTTPSSPSTPNNDKHDLFAAAFSSQGHPSRAVILRSYALTSRSFRSLSQPLLFRDPVLQTSAAIRAFLAALEDDENGRYLARQVRTITLGAKSEAGALGVEMEAVDVGGVLRRLARACGEVRELEMNGMGSVKLEDLEGMSHLRSLTMNGCQLAPSTAYSPDWALTAVHLTLTNCLLAPDSLSATLFPSLKAFKLTTPRDPFASSSDQLAHFLAGIAPRLRSFSLHDQAGDTLDAGAADSFGAGFNLLAEAFPHFSPALTHLDIVNALPTHALSLLPIPSLLSLRTLSLSLSGSLAAGASRLTPRWAPLADIHLRDVLSVLRILLLPPSALFPPSELLDGAADVLPAWVGALQRSEALERVLLPQRAFEDGLGEMVRELEGELRAVGRAVALLPLMEGDDAEVKDTKDGAEFWREVARREKEEKDERRRAERWW